MFRDAFRKGKFTFISRPLLSAFLLASPNLSFAQHHGGHGMESGSIPGATGRPTGLDEKDSLRDFHQVLAEQATSEQVAEFQKIINATKAAKDKLSAFSQATGQREGVGGMDQSIEAARTASRKFQEGFSEAQKSGLKEITKRLEKADFDVDQEAKHLDQSIQSEAGKTDLASHADALDKALNTFLDQELALGREMGIMLASGDDVTFNLHPVRNTVVLAHETIAVPVSGVLSQSEMQGPQRTLKIYVTANLSDLQQNIAQILGDEVNAARTCGERVWVREASVMPAPPASSLVARLHYERWSCAGFGTSSSTELAESDGVVEIKMTPAVGLANVVKIVPQFERIEASGMLGDALRSGDLGTDLLRKAANLVSTAVQTSADFKITLPAAIESGATLQRAAFQDIGAGPFSLLLEGEVQVSNEQANLLASQLNQALSAPGSAGK